MEFNIADVQENLASAYPHREAIAWSGRRRSAGELNDRSRRLADLLVTAGLGVTTQRAALAPHQSGQDHLAVYLYDCPEFVETMLGAYKARVVPFNVNYRYVSHELSGLLRTGRPRAIVYHGAFTPILAEVLGDVPRVDVLLRVDDGSGHALLPNAVDFEEALALCSPEPPRLTRSPDDLYMVFTGGTTGLPKGVLWRQADIFVAGMGGWDARCGRREWESLDELAEAAATPAPRILAAAPLMHGAGQWPAFQAIVSAGTLVLPGVMERRDPADLLRTVEQERVEVMVIVGDAFARPMLEEMDRAHYDLSSLRMLVTGGAGMSAEVRAGWLDRLPGLVILDTMGSSEGGAQARGRTKSGERPSMGQFQPFPGTCVIDETRSRVLPPGHEGLGWLATTGRIPLGYLDDEVRTAATFPVIGERRMVVPGDRARHLAGGAIEVLGRDSVCINSGGEKIFAEEVEAAIIADPRIVDVTVVGRPSERWGSEVVAVVCARPGSGLVADDVIAVAGQRLARYKLPKDVVFVDRVERSPAGKPDYRWALAQATAASQLAGADHLSS